MAHHFTKRNLVMNSKIFGITLGALGMCLWFMPMVYFDMMGTDAYQAGNHIGGIAYLLLMSSLAYAVLTWMDQHVPRVIAVAVGLAICLLFLIQAGSAAAWGLLALLVLNVFAASLALRDAKTTQAVAAE